MSVDSEPVAWGARAAVPAHDVRTVVLARVVVLVALVDICRKHKHVRTSEYYTTPQHEHVTLQIQDR